MIAVITLVVGVGSLVMSGCIVYQLRKVMGIVEAINKPKPGRRWCRIHRQNFNTTTDSTECPKCKDR